MIEQYSLLNFQCYTMFTIIKCCNVHRFTLVYFPRNFQSTLLQKKWLFHATVSKLADKQHPISYISYKTLFNNFFPPIKFYADTQLELCVILFPFTIILNYKVILKLRIKCGTVGERIHVREWSYSNYGKDEVLKYAKRKL